MAFSADPSPDAVEKPVDRLPALPHYGERMAEAWLDLEASADNAGGSRRGLTALRDQLAHDLAVDISEAEVAARVAVGEPLVVEAQRV